MSTPSPTARRVSLPRWLDLRLVLGVVLVLAAVLLGAVVVSRAGDTRPTVTAAHDLAAGTVLQRSDLQIAQTQLSSSARRVYLADMSEAVGRRLVRPVSAGELVPRASVTAVRTGTTLTVPFAAGAVPDLRAGQRIKVWVSSATCSSVVLLDDVTVQSVHADDAALGAATGGQDVVISVTPDQADRVVAALGLDGAQIRAGVLVGPDSSTDPASDSPPAAQPTTPSAGSTGGSSGRLPADLAVCASSAR